MFELIWRPLSAHPNDAVRAAGRFLPKSIAYRHRLQRRLSSFRREANGVQSTAFRSGSIREVHLNNSNSIFSTVMRRHVSLAAGLLLLLTPSLAVGAPAPWIQAISAGGGGNNLSNAVKVAPDNSRYVTGQFSSTAVFSGTTLTSTGGLDIFIAKYGPSGNLLWIVKAGGTSDDIGYSLDLDANGNILVTGQFITSATFGTTSGAPKTVTGLGRAIFLAKYSPTGALLWVQTGIVTFDGWYNWGFGVAVDGTTGAAYVAAISQGDTTFSSTNGTIHSVTGVVTWHMVLAKYDTNGNFLWAQTNQASPNSIPNAVAVDASGNAYVAGWLENTTSFSSADGHSISVIGFSPGQANTDFPDDAFLAKYDGNGNLKWVNHIGGYKAIASGISCESWGRDQHGGFCGQHQLRHCRGSSNRCHLSAAWSEHQPGGRHIHKSL